MENKIYSQNDLDITQLKKYFNAATTFEGCIVKNYKLMCELLNEIPTDGNSKKAQINRWKRYFDFHKDGQKFIIDEIYDEPFTTDDARKRREGLYVKYIELLLLEFLSKQPDYKVTMGNKEMYDILGMTNERYNIRNKLGISRANEIIRKTIMNNEDKFEFTNNPTISHFDINNFYLRAEQKLNKVLYSALKSMKDRFLIDYKKVNIIVEYKNGTDTCPTYRESDASEDKMILEAKNFITKQMGYSSMTEIMLYYKSEEFYERFNAYIKEKYNWDKCYPQLRVVYINDIAKQIPLKAEEIRKLTQEDKKTQLNTEIINSLNIQAEKRYKEADEKFQTYECNRIANEKNNRNDFNVVGEEKPFVYKSDYVEIQKALADYLLNINSDSSKISSKKIAE